MKNQFLRIFTVLSILTFFVPLAIFPSDLIVNNFIFPFIVPKILFFRSLVLLMLIPYIYLIFTYKKEFAPFKHWLHYAVGIYFASLFLSTFFGVDWYNSFWDNHERMLGFFTLFHYFLYYLMISIVFRKKEEWQKLQWWFLGTGSLVMLIAIFQRISPDYLLNGGSWRVASTLGNPIYVGGFGLFLGYIGYLLGMQEKIFWRRLTAFGLGFLGVVGIFLSGTRGTLLGLMASIGVLLLIYLIFLKGNKKIRMAIGTIMLLGLVLLGILFAFRTSPLVQSIPSVGRLVNSSLTGDSAGTRLIAWGIAFESWQERPVFGWGPNNYYYAFNKYYRPASLYFGVGETWFDNAHNIIMNTLSTQGIIGVVSYLSLFVIAIVYCFRGYRRGQLDIHTLAVGVAFLVGHLIHNVFVFENPTSYLYFFFFLAWVASLTRDSSAQSLSGRASGSLSPLVKFGVPVVIFVVIYITNINVAKANMATLDAVHSVYQGNVPLSLEYYERAKSFHSPHIGDIRSDYIRGGSQLVEQAYRANKNSPQLQDFMNYLYEEQNKNREFRPLDIRIHLLQSQMAILSDVLKPDANRKKEAEKLLLDAQALSPRRQQIQFILAGIYISEGRTEEGLKLIEQAVEAEPRAGESWVKLVTAYVQTNQPQKAVAAWQEAKTRGALFTPDQKAILSQLLGQQI